MNPNILIVEDEPGIRNFLTAILTANQFDALTARSGQEAYSMITSRCPDLVILDLGLPDMDGMRIIRAVRQWSSLPILVVSARAHERDKVEALDAGADDYIVKPFGTSELLARVRTALRHAQQEPEGPGGVFRAGELEIDYEKRRVTLGGEEVHLTLNESKIVSLLSRHAGKVLTYDYLMKEIWGPAAGKGNQILRVNMANIRRKLEKNPAAPVYIFTETGVGYRMREAD